MARCNNETLLSKIGINNIDKQTEVDFAVLTDLDSCIKINAKNYVATVGATAEAYNGYRRPADAFNCLAEGCVNTGTLLVTGTQDAEAGARYAVPYDATDYYAGVATFYVYLPAGTYTVSFTISDITNTTQTNADVYTQTVTAAQTGFVPVVIDFSRAPTSQNGAGWAASESGALITVTILTTGGTAGAVIEYGLSSFYFYSSVEDFEVNDVVKVGCLSEISGDLTVDATDASCWGGGYDAESISIERTITGGKVTPNYWKLSPLVSKGSKTEGWEIQNSAKEVVGAVTYNGIAYGYIELSDMATDECSFVSAQISDDCNVTDSMLTRVSAIAGVSIHERQFIVMTGAAPRILVHASLIGQTVVYSYPKKAMVEQYVANDENLDARRTRMSFPVRQTDGTKVVYIYNNVLVTSFPATISNEGENTFDFTISIQRDKNGNFFEMSKIID